MRSAGEAAHRELENLRLVAKKQEEILAHQARQIEQKDQTNYSLRAEMDKLRQKESTLRTIILDKAGTQKVSDQEITSKFTNLRRRIESIVRLPIYRVNLEPVLSRKVDDKEVFAFFDEKLWGGLNQDDRKKRVTSKIFQLINKRILDFRIFGAEGLPVETKGDVPTKSLAYGLRHAEIALEVGGGR